MHANQTGEPREACLGYSAGSKIGGAVERNRAKRRMREAVRPLRERLTRGVDLILVATSNTPTCGFQELVDSVERGAAKTGALNG
jgi:ribonuclease P protein component